MLSSNSYLRTYRFFRKSMNKEESFKSTLQVFLDDISKDPRRKTPSTYKQINRLFKAFCKKALTEEYVKELSSLPEGAEFCLFSTYKEKNQDIFSPYTFFSA